VFWTAAALLCLRAQLAERGAAAQTPESNDVPTLHAYTNLVQVPTLVLGHDRKPIPAMDERRFFVSLDGGPKLRVTHARLEGADPLSGAILLDMSQADPGEVSQADQAIADLAPNSVHEQDEVFIYAMDCRLIRPQDGGATDAATLRRHVDLVMRQSQPRSGKGADRCQNPINLWDSLVSLVQTLSTRPGRRVILAVTDGVDRVSRNSWNDLRAFAQEESVAIFGFVQPADVMSKQNNSANLEKILQEQSPSGQAEPLFNGVCELSGGEVLTTSGKDLGKQLAWAVTLIRGRYIVEFPRPMSTVGGVHNLEISIYKSRAIIRPTGAGVPTMDPAILKDPTTVPSDPSLAPQLGNRRILQPK
jgi:VWFA-related protein